IVLTLYYGFVCTIGFLYTPHRLDNRLFPYTTLFRSLDFLPESHTDFIIAVLAEEFGLLGVCLLLLLYVLIVARGLYIASQAQDRSEEHTSELQSRENIVCRLLLEKKIIMSIYIQHHD